MQYFSCGSDKYSEIKMCDLEPFSKIRSHIALKAKTNGFTFAIIKGKIHYIFTLLVRLPTVWYAGYLLTLLNGWLLTPNFVKSPIYPGGGA